MIDKQSEPLQKLLENHSSVFSEEFGYLKGTSVKLEEYSDVRPRFIKLVERELDDL